MPTQPTELARIEAILREQLAGGRAGRAGDASAPARLAARITKSVRSFLGELFSAPRSARRLAEWMRAPVRAAAARLGRRRQAPDPLRELQDLLDAAREGLSVIDEPAGRRRPDRGGAASGQAVHEERALDELFPRDGGRGDPYAARGRLPNLSRARASDARMKDSPRRDWGPPPAVQFPMPPRKDGRRSDFVIAGLGLALGLVCAVFPWYIFFNQDQFGVQAIRFGGRGGNAGRATVEARQDPGATPVAEQEMPDRDLDPFATGTLQTTPENPAPPPGPDQQPFPAEAPPFHLVHVANGRAMIEDDTGLWVVQQGSVLPDSSVVRSIEQRNGRWVLVTSTDKVLEVSR